MKYATLIGAASATLMDPAEYQFMAHIVHHGISYGTKAEYNFRFQVYKETLAEVERINNDPAMTHKAKTNFLSTWTSDEKKKLLGYRASNRTRNPVRLDVSTTNAELDWRSKGAVTPVKNQGQCGSCWSFSTTGALEGAHFISAGNLVSLSEQQFVDCDTQYDQGCNGGLMDNAFTYAESTPIMTEAEYPYVARRQTTNKKCSDAAQAGVVSVNNFKDVPVNEIAQMKAYLDKGPVSVAIEADKYVFQTYTSGVITGSTCGTQLDHGVLAVGYGTLDGDDYFLVKNSWGPSWGDEGYVRLGQNNVCGILQAASQPLTN